MVFKRLAILSPLFQPVGPINAVLSHPALPLTITGHEDRHIRFYDNNTGALVHRYLKTKSSLVANLLTSMSLVQHGGAPGQCDKLGSGPARPLSHLWKPRLQHQVTCIGQEKNYCKLWKRSSCSHRPHSGCGILKARRACRR